jgi:hypothetical protein
MVQIDRNKKAFSQTTTNTQELWRYAFNSIVSIIEN